MTAEQTLIFGAESHLVATLTSPLPGSVRQPWIAVLTNSGVIPRSGPHRMNVRLARRFAALGIASIRFDMSGLGDSRRASGTLPVVQQWVADTRAAMDTAQARFGSDRFFMVGFCSGAEVAHLVALEDTRLRAALLWDLYAYPTPEFKLRAVLHRLHRAGWRQVLGKIAHRVLRPLRGGGVPSPAARVPEVSTVPPREVFAQRVQALTDAGVELLFAYCGGESLWFNHRGQFRRMFAGHAFLDKVAFEFLEMSDHLVTRHEAQVAFVEMTEGWLRQRLKCDGGGCGK